MTIAELLEEAADWRAHLYTPESRVFQIINAARPNSSDDFKPEEVVKRYEADRANRVKEFVDAVDNFKQK